ncbi:sulfate ABC transporter substrate-binding protein [Shewanella algae]|uniref:DUF1998 domain-containing protein n=1 Tax=Shewanella algae TaxID=38313 RepID=UPI0011834EC6|nr:DUF1998 domain-containing protein [Shewanella algae]TVK93752.1 sulfate ABC transporter substrate-binding protein [Shewanella algae]
MSNKVHVGEVRPSQLLWTYGPGALIDLPNLSVVTLGLDVWEEERCKPIEEVRLLNAVRERLGPQVAKLRLPPFVNGDRVDPFSAEAKIGVPVKPFPRWLRCVSCGLLAEYDSGLFEIKDNLFRPEMTRFIHANCDKRKNKGASDAVPARFLMACSKGHLDDFPWHWFVHDGRKDCKGTLRFFESGASLQTENLWVKCDKCGDSKSLVHAFGEEAKQNLPGCRGRHPHLNRFEPNCDANSRAVLLGATNSWFPVTLSALVIPLEKDPVSQIVSDGWDYFEDIENELELKMVVKTLIKSSSLPGIENYEISELWASISARNGHPEDNPELDGQDIKRPEWEALTKADLRQDWPHFLATPIDAPKSFQSAFQRVLLVERLREVNALLGFTRVESPDEKDADAKKTDIASLCANAKPTWVPVSEVHGEGIFIQFSEEQLSRWEKLSEVRKQDAKLLKAHHAWRMARGLEPGDFYPGIRYVLLHSLAHLLIRELALECGYNAASIRERIYADNDAKAPMAGILIYTAAADSDGTLGGLVDLGRPENLDRLLKQALYRAKICSSDPLCAEHDPTKDQSLHIASCHACSFVSETSCEKGNRYLDRSLLVRTLQDIDNLAFFDDELAQGLTSE